MGRQFRTRRSVGLVALAATAALIAASCGGDDDDDAATEHRRGHRGGDRAPARRAFRRVVGAESSAATVERAGVVEPPRDGARREQRRWRGRAAARDRPRHGHQLARHQPQLLRHVPDLQHRGLRDADHRRSGRPQHARAAARDGMGSATTTTRSSRSRSIPTATFADGSPVEASRRQVVVGAARQHPGRRPPT